MLISANAFVTLDGVMQGPGGPEEDVTNGFEQGGWIVPFDVEGWGHVVDGWFKKASAVLLGRSTFESMRGYWPEVTEADNRVATVLNQGKKYVVSTTLSDAQARWGNTTVIGDDVVDTVSKLKRGEEGELQIHGSWQLVRTLHDAGLIDVFRILQFPVVVGRGKRFFGDDPVPTGFEVSDAAVLHGGVVSMELQQTRFGSVAVGAYTVQDGRESVA